MPRSIGPLVSVIAERRILVFIITFFRLLGSLGRRHNPAHFTCDFNLIWHDQLPVLIQTAKGEDWAEWQKAGFDAHSLIADPLFADAPHDDYHLKPESPATSLGFQPIPINQIGPYRDALRASWPIVEAEGAREKPPKPPKVPTTTPTLHK